MYKKINLIVYYNIIEDSYLYIAIEYFKIELEFYRYFLLKNMTKILNTYIKK